MYSLRPYLGVIFVLRAAILTINFTNKKYDMFHKKYTVKNIFLNTNPIIWFLYQIAHVLLVKYMGKVDGRRHLNRDGGII